MSIQLEARHLPALQKLWDAVLSAHIREAFSEAREVLHEQPRKAEALSAISDACIDLMCFHEGIDLEAADA